jgi:copper chaperone
MFETRTYSVPAMTCGHCKSSIEGEVNKLGGIVSVTVDLDAKTVQVAGDTTDEAIRAAIDEAGFDIA